MLPQPIAIYVVMLATKCEWIFDTSKNLMKKAQTN
jgi:hypothetical protein